jgi:putative Ca2+/H+ antiporter (TMEM165/GDT1 family)
VTGGAILGHAICALIAVIGGRVIAGRISEKQVTLIGGILFIIFGVVAAIS